MRAASSAPVGGRAAGAGAASADTASPFEGWSGGVRGWRSAAAAELGEPRGIRLAGREPVEAQMVEAECGDAELGAPEVLAPAAPVVAQPVAVDQVRQDRVGIAALGEDLDGAGDMRKTFVVEPFAGLVSGQCCLGDQPQRVGSVAGGRGEGCEPSAGGAHAAGGLAGPRPPKSIETRSPLPLWTCGAAASLGRSSTEPWAAASVLSPWPISSAGSPCES